MPQFELPDVGEGLTEAEIVAWKVRPGDEVSVNDVLVEIETAKSLVELPSPYAGTVEELLVDEGEVIPVGTPIVRISGDEEAGSEQPESVLVGYGPRRGRRRRRPSAAADEGRAALHGAFGTGHDVGVRVAPPEHPQPVRPIESTSASPLPEVGSFADQRDEAPGRQAGGRRPRAKPPVRRLARDLGVDLADVRPSGPNDTITRADVEAQAKAMAETAGGAREERVPVRSVRRATARAVVASAFTVPHVTQFVTTDVTASVALLDRLRGDRRFEGLRLSPLTLAARAMVAAAATTPEVNAYWDATSDEIVYRRYVDLGVATATDRGLIVPVVRDADRLTLPQLAEAIADLSRRAREGSTTPRETSGGTLSVTNIGVFGMDTGTPIIPPGQSVILALGQVARRPWVVERDGSEVVQPRWVTTLALSFDHRLVDGAQASAFLADVATSLADPGLAWALA